MADIEIEQYWEDFEIYVTVPYKQKNPFYEMELEKWDGTEVDRQAKMRDYEAKLKDYETAMEIFEDQIALYRQHEKDRELAAKRQQLEALKAELEEE